MEIVIVESPYRGRTEAETAHNVAYARACMADCLTRNEAPYASHLLYTQPGVLRDEDPAERSLGIVAGFEFRRFATKTLFYQDRGVSSGMKMALCHCNENQLPYEVRHLGGDWAKPFVEPLPEPKKVEIAAQHAANVLNELLRVDPGAAWATLLNHFPCNQEVVDHPVLTCTMINTMEAHMQRRGGGAFASGLGVINSIFYQTGYNVAAIIGDGTLKGFAVVGDSTKPVACGFVPPTAGYAPCTRNKGHDGPCAHELEHLDGKF